MGNAVLWVVPELGERLVDPLPVRGLLDEGHADSVLFLHKLLGLLRVGVLHPAVGVRHLVPKVVLHHRRVSSRLGVLQALHGEALGGFVAADGRPGEPNVLL